MVDNPLIARVHLVQIVKTKVLLLSQWGAAKNIKLESLILAQSER